MELYRQEDISHPISHRPGAGTGIEHDGHEREPGTHGILGLLPFFVLAGYNSIYSIRYITPYNSY